MELQRPPLALGTAGVGVPVGGAGGAGTWRPPRPCRWHVGHGRAAATPRPPPPMYPLVVVLRTKGGGRVEQQLVGGVSSPLVLAPSALWTQPRRGVVQPRIRSIENGCGHEL